MTKTTDIVHIYIYMYQNIDCSNYKIFIDIDFLNINIFPNIYQGHRQLKSCTSKSLFAVAVADLETDAASARSDTKVIRLNFHTPDRS